MLNPNCNKRKTSKAMDFICLIDIMHNYTMNKVTQVRYCASVMFNQSKPSQIRARRDYGLVVVWGLDAK